MKTPNCAFWWRSTRRRRFLQVRKTREAKRGKTPLQPHKTQRVIIDSTLLGERDIAKELSCVSVKTPASSLAFCDMQAVGEKDEVKGTNTLAFVVHGHAQLMQVPGRSYVECSKRCHTAREVLARSRIWVAVRRVVQKIHARCNQSIQRTGTFIRSQH